MILLDVNQSFAPKEERLNEALLHSVERLVNERVRDVPEGEIAISYVSDEEIRRLNRMYRKKDAVTDVLSFSNIHEVAVGHLGDIVISFDQARRQAEGGDLELELTDLIVHGILHVLGFDHELPSEAKEMFTLQDGIVQAVL